MRNQPLPAPPAEIVEERLEAMRLGELRVDRRHAVLAIGAAQPLVGLAQRLVGDGEHHREAQPAAPRALEPGLVGLLMRGAVPGRPAVEDRRTEIRLGTQQEAVAAVLGAGADRVGARAELQVIAVEQVLAAERQEGGTRRRAEVAAVLAHQIEVGAVVLAQRAVDSVLGIEGRAREHAATVGEIREEMQVEIGVAAHRVAALGGRRPVRRRLRDRLDHGAHARRREAAAAGAVAAAAGHFEEQRLARLLRLTDATRALAASAARRERRTGPARLDAGRQVPTLPGVGIRDLGESAVARRGRLADAAGTLAGSAARRDDAAHGIGLDARDRVAALTRVRRRQLDEVALAGAELRFEGAAGALALRATRRDRGAHAARLDARDRIAALAGVRLRQLDEARLTRAEVRLARAARALPRTAARRDGSADAVRLDAGNRVAALA